ncbi:MULTISPECIES: MetQ/NlpA family ABC transporter substrate-binding protein [unclassified Nostoc]|uniref:MetQ/NlpA family ABC transporter substrate-binding protein n=1 Tax=unclassified Nostoc TaxID=2593658 RepID=UPI00391B56EA
MPDDPSNAHRALKVLEESGLLKLKVNVRPASPKDIIENPKKINVRDATLSPQQYAAVTPKDVKP